MEEITFSLPFFTAYTRICVRAALADTWKMPENF